jgi:hypothetical protein
LSGTRSVLGRVLALVPELLNRIPGKHTDQLKRPRLEEQDHCQADLRLTLAISAQDSTMKPRAQRRIPTISLAVPNDGLSPPLEKSETAGELSITTGRAESIEYLRYSRQSRSLEKTDQGLVLTDSPDPYDLAHPEPSEFEEMRSDVIEPVIAWISSSTIMTHQLLSVTIQ